MLVLDLEDEAGVAHEDDACVQRPQRRDLCEWLRLGEHRPERRRAVLLVLDEEVVEPRLRSGSQRRQRGDEHFSASAPQLGRQTHRGPCDVRVWLGVAVEHYDNAPPLPVDRCKLLDQLDPSLLRPPAVDAAKACAREAFRTGLRRLQLAFRDDEFGAGVAQHLGPPVEQDREEDVRHRPRLLHVPWKLRVEAPEVARLLEPAHPIEVAARVGDEQGREARERRRELPGLLPRQRTQPQLLCLRVVEPAGTPLGLRERQEFLRRHWSPRIRARTCATSLATARSP
jgi:hypothetical protein